MHMQIRLAAAASPPDLERLLGVLAAESVNIVAVGGGDVELGGEFAFAVEPPGTEGHVHSSDEDDDAELSYVEEVLAILRRAGYQPRAVRTGVHWLENRPGALLEAVATVAAENLEAGRVIRDVTIGIAIEDGRVPVQIYSQEVKVRRADISASEPVEPASGVEQRSAHGHGHGHGGHERGQGHGGHDEH
jgi:hypothetical protein